MKSALKAIITIALGLLILCPLFVTGMVLFLIGVVCFYELSIIDGLIYFNSGLALMIMVILIAKYIDDKGWL